MEEQTDYDMKRDFCPRCAIKHLAQARALTLEIRKGYPVHVWFAMGHMAEAEDEIQEFMPEQAEKIRDARKLMETTASAGLDWKFPNWEELLMAIGTEAMLEELATEDTISYRHPNPYGNVNFSTSLNPLERNDHNK